MTRWVLAAAMFTAVGWLTGCATMIHGTTQSIPVTSEPVGAEVWTNGQFLATTPTTLTLRRKPDYDIEVKKEGFEVARVRLESKSEHDASSILLGGPIGWRIDASTGGNKRLYPESVHVVLRALPLPVAAISFETQIAQLEALKAKGTITEEEYTVMRRRLVESVSAATLVPSSLVPTPPGPPPAPLEQWLVGAWDGRHWRGDRDGLQPTALKIVRAGVELRWELTFTASGSQHAAAGTATVRGDTVEMRGWFLGGGSGSRSVKLSLTRSGDILLGTGSGIENEPFQASYQKRAP